MSDRPVPVMLRNLKDILPAPFRALAERFDRSPIESVEGLTHFVQTRAAYVAQTSLYGYLKTRMGTQFRELFQDAVFSVAIRRAAMKVYVSALGDLTVFAVATARSGTALGDHDAASLARSCFDDALERVLGTENPGDIPHDVVEAVRQRLLSEDWERAAEGENAFWGSARDLIRFAPVIDEFKELDSAIVVNSIRFKWRDVREQYRKRANGPAIVEDWRRTMPPAR